MNNAKPAAGQNVTELSFPSVDGQQSIAIGQPKQRWTMLHSEFVRMGR